MKHKLTPEQEDYLTEILEHPGIAPLLAQLDVIIGSLERDVVSLCIDTPDSERELVKRKLRLEGASKLAANFRQRIQSLKLKRKS